MEQHVRHDGGMNEQIVCLYRYQAGSGDIGVKPRLIHMLQMNLWQLPALMGSNCDETQKKTKND